MKLLKPWLISAVLLLSSLTVAAEELKVLIMPLEVKGSYHPVNEDQLSEFLKADIEKLGSTFSAEISEQKSYFMMPDSEIAKAAKAAGADFVLYGDVTFRKDTTTLGGSTSAANPGSGVPMSQGQERYQISIAGMGHAYLYDVAKGEIVARESELMLENETIGTLLVDGTASKAEKEAGQRCVQDLATRVVKKLAPQLKK